MRILSSALLALLVAVPLAAQTVPDAAPRNGGQLVDRVVAVVGDSVLLLSEVQAEVQQYQAATGQPLPEDPEALEQIIRQAVESAVADMILLQAAKKAGVTVRDEAIQEMVDQEIRAAQQRFGSEREFRNALSATGMTLDQYRTTIHQRYRDRAVRDQFLRQRLANLPRPPVSEAEIRATFAASGSELRERPANISFDQVIVVPQASDSARAEALRSAQDVLGELHRGGDFEVLARRFSEDPGSRQHGGDLGWFRRGRMVPAFENAVYALRPGQISPIVETEFGFHIIRLERARGTERQARHILIRPHVSDADRDRARARADSLAAASRAGAPLPQMRMPAGIPADQRSVERVVIDRLPSEYSAAMRDVDAGGIAGPFEIQLPSGEPGWVIARVTARQESGTFTLDDIRDQILEHLQMQKMEAALIDELRAGMFVDLRI